MFQFYNFWETNNIHTETDNSRITQFVIQSAKGPSDCVQQISF